MIGIFVVLAVFGSCIEEERQNVSRCHCLIGNRLGLLARWFTTTISGFSLVFVDPRRDVYRCYTKTHCSLATLTALGDYLEAGSSIIKIHRFNLTRSEELPTIKTTSGKTPSHRR